MKPVSESPPPFRAWPPSSFIYKHPRWPPAWHPTTPIHLQCAPGSSSCKRCCSQPPCPNIFSAFAPPASHHVDLGSQAPETWSHLWSPTENRTQRPHLASMTTDAASQLAYPSPPAWFASFLAWSPCPTKHIANPTSLGNSPMTAYTV